MNVSLWLSAVTHRVQFPKEGGKWRAQKPQGNKNKGRSLLPAALSSIDHCLNVTQSPPLCRLPLTLQSHAQAILFQGNTELICLKPCGTSQAALSRRGILLSLQNNSALGGGRSWAQFFSFSSDSPESLRSQVAPGQWLAETVWFQYFLCCTNFAMSSSSPPSTLKVTLGGCVI